MLSYVRNQNNTYYGWRRFPLGSQKELRKLEQKVKKLEAKVEQLEKRTNESTAKRVTDFLLILLELAVAILTIIGLVS